MSRQYSSSSEYKSSDSSAEYDIHGTIISPQVRPSRLSNRGRNHLPPSGSSDSSDIDGTVIGPQDPPSFGLPTGDNNHLPPSGGHGPLPTGQVQEPPSTEPNQSHADSLRLPNADDYRNYDLRRRQAYPTTHHRQFATEDLRDGYYAYSQITQESNQRVAQYHQQYRSVTGPNRDRAMTEGNPYHENQDVPMGELDRAQHGTLRAPAHRAAISTTRNANRRREYLQDHPFGYQTREQRERHEDLATDAQNESLDYHNRYNTHLNGSRQT